MEKSSQHVPPGAVPKATGSAGSSAATDRAPSSGDAGSGGTAAGHGGDQGGLGSGAGRGSTGSGGEEGGAMSRGRPAVSGEEIQKVQNLIERCMQLYMTQVRDECGAERCMTRTVLSEHFLNLLQPLWLIVSLSSLIWIPGD